MMLIGWGSGTLACTLGLALSFALDLPTGPLVVCTFGAVLLAAWLVRLVLQRRAEAA
jgi:ABC-type Mn2+/Zn2+ transport system permease subunit